MNNGLKVGLFILVVLFALVIGPLLFIWGINTLIAAAMALAPATTFVPHIAFTPWTWLACVAIGMVINRWTATS